MNLLKKVSQNENSNLLKKVSQNENMISNLDKKEGLKKSKIFLVVSLMIVLFFSLFVSINFVSAQATTTCCEKTIDGSYCQDVAPSKCDINYLASPTSCDATSYCELGTCYDSDEGLCMRNTPKRACEEANGLWTAEESPRQCNLGCCVLGEQAAFTTLQRCKKLAGTFGLQADFRDDIPDEVSCIAIANAQDIGACVFESDFTRTCTFGTRGECNANSVSIEGEEITSGEVKFFKDVLCTSEELGTNCQKTSKTTCVDGKDEVYFLDTCGNTANIYDSTKLNDKNYWERVVSKDQSCKGNPRNCGNCDYLGGSICAPSQRGESAVQGNFVCRDVNCYDTSNGKDYINGESWCQYDNGKSDDDRVGSRHYRHICFMGEEIVEPCKDLRIEICVEDAIETEAGESFAQAGCVVNRAADCLLQERRSDCLNTDKRDCRWIPVSIGGKDIAANAIESVTSGISGLLLNVYDSRRDQGACVPDISPGLPFWDESSVPICDQVSSSCVITYEKRLIGGKRKCVDNCFCDIEENPQIAIQALNICSSVGDCGPGQNYVGKFVNKGYEFAIEDKQIGPDLDLGIFNPDKAVNTPGGPADPVANPEFDQGRGRGNEFPSASQPASPTGNIIRELYRRMG